jgi:DNA-binding transcriptional LysR family regulator
MAATAHALVRAGTAIGEKIAGTVRITCSEEMASEVLPAILATLMAKHPSLAIELSPSNRLEDLLRRRTDIALRMTQPKQQGLLTRKLSPVEFGLFARPSYLAAHGIPAEPASLRHHMMIGPENGGGMRAMLDLVGLGESDLPLAYRSDSAVAQLAALRAGIGIGICQTSLAGQELIRVLPQFTLKLELWIAMQEDMRARTSVRAVFDHLAQELREAEREVQSSSSSSTAAESTVERISL